MYWLDNNTGISTAPTPPAVISLTKRFFTNGGLGEQPSIPEDFWFNMVQEELLGVLTLAGITPDKSDLNQVAKAIQSIAFSAYPVGAPIPWPTAVPPPGFLAMTGQSFSPVTYPKLAQAYPSLVLTDMRADFIRGWDNGRGVDVGRSIMSSQPATSVGKLLGNLSGAAYIGVENPDGVYNGSASWSQISATSIAVSQQVFSRFRPQNIAFNYIVRAA